MQRIPRPLKLHNASALACTLRILSITAQQGSLCELQHRQAAVPAPRAVQPRLRESEGGRHARPPAAKAGPACLQDVCVQHAARLLAVILQLLQESSRTSRQSSMRNEGRAARASATQPKHTAAQTTGATRGLACSQQQQGGGCTRLPGRLKRQVGNKDAAADRQRAAAAAALRPAAARPQQCKQACCQCGCAGWSGGEGLDAPSSAGEQAASRGTARTTALCAPQSCASLLNPPPISPTTPALPPLSTPPTGRWPPTHPSPHPSPRTRRTAAWRGPAPRCARCRRSGLSRHAAQSPRGPPAPRWGAPPARCRGAG